MIADKFHVYVRFRRGHGSRKPTRLCTVPTLDEARNTVANLAGDAMYSDAWYEEDVASRTPEENDVQRSIHREGR